MGWWEKRRWRGIKIGDEGRTDVVNDITLEGLKPLEIRVGNRRREALYPNGRVSLRVGMYKGDQITHVEDGAIAVAHFAAWTTM